MIPWKWLYLKFTHQTQHQDGEVLGSQGLLVVTFTFVQARSARSGADVVTNFYGEAYNSVFSPLPPHHTRMRCTQSFSCVQLFVTPWTAACQASLSKGFFQARILEWVAISSSRRSSWPRNPICVSCVSCIGQWVFHHWDTWEAPSSPSDDVNWHLSYLRRLTCSSDIVWQLASRGTSHSLSTEILQTGTCCEPVVKPITGVFPTLISNSLNQIRKEVKVDSEVPMYYSNRRKIFLRGVTWL